ncbi:putative membrane protein YeaQ/YmgE (transglycosylase-associated protein family) [Breoghania corrubedonensis]|uniref:Putative membrane protein YeaQ/YmgE (Transglycosylase-associated protein family) n=1 Tax=Breoghania corrubedonensis TaxID=665038 RepID=A0A2T5V952_9HYPH|nr:putative membrane protein YeaQ/YmgE (transglycosylase-associated protein family) [Breoghania corrubedonensis]
MHMYGFGWFLTIVIGALAGWIAEKIMKANHGLLLNIVLGILGAVIANALLFRLIGHTMAGFIGQLAVAVGGACLLIFLFRAIRR